MEKVIYSTQSNSGFVDGTLEIYSDRLILIGKKKTIEYKFIDMTSASHSFGCLNVTLKNGKTDVFSISDKKLRLEIIDYINNQLTNTDTKSNNQIEEKRVENVSKEKQVNSTDEVKVNDNQNNSNKSNPLEIISAIISIIVFVIIAINFFGNGGHIEGAYFAEQSALKEIPESVLTLTFEHAVTSDELKCNAKEKTDDEIILVKCTTTNEHIIDYYKSETIWYAFQETADGSHHYRAINPDKNKALESIRKK